VRDNIRGWRAEPKIFFGLIISQTASLITPPYLAGKPERMLYMFDEAFRWCTLGLNVRYANPPLIFVILTVVLQISHVTWSFATALFEDLTRMNLNTSSSIERAYKKDIGLLWRFVTCHSLVEYEQNRQWWNVRLEVSWSEYFRPYFKREHVSVLRIAILCFLLIYRVCAAWERCHEN